MQRIFTILFLIVGITQSFGQDTRIQEPIKNFDKLWNEFNDRYAFFEFKNIDWNDVYKKYRPLINEKTTNDSLFKVCNKMQLELKDGHVYIEQYGKNGKLIQKSEDGNSSLLIKNFPISKESKPNVYQLIKVTEKTLEKNTFSNLTSSKNGIINYSTSKEYGYLSIFAMQGLSLGEYKKYIDNAIKTFENKKGVIIDIRFNGGGKGKVAFAIASRFTDKKRIAHYMKERKRGTNNYTELETTYTEPLGKIQFTKPIVLITSDFTASASEEFTLAMKELPYLTILGDNTNGSFSDNFTFKLPNKWHVSLSHQQYFDADMKNYEGIGLEPDIRLLNKTEDIANGTDPLIVKAIEILDEKNNR